MPRVAIRDFKASLSLGTVISNEPFLDPSITPVTWLAWAKCSAFSGLTLGDFRNAALGESVRLTVENSTGHLFVWVVNAAGVGGTNLKVLQRIPFNRWIRVGFSYDPGNQEVRIWLNGALLGSATSTLAPRAGGYVYARGNSAWSTADVATFNRVLTVEDIAADYFNGVLPAVPVSRWMLDEGAGSVAFDATGHDHIATIQAPAFSAGVPMKTRKTLNPNLIANGDFEFSPRLVAPQTMSNRWVDGTVAGSVSNQLFGLYAGLGNGGGEVCFDSDKKHSGSQSLLVHTIPGGYAEIRCGATSYYQARGQELQPNTDYVLTYWMKTEYVAGDVTEANNGAYVQYLVSNSQGANAGSYTNGTKLKMTTGWTQYTIAFTTQSTAAWGHPEFRIYGHSGAIDTLEMKAWYDDVELRQVIPIARPNIAGPYRQPINNLVRNGDFEFAPTLITPTNVGAQYIDGTAGGGNTASQYGAWATVSLGAGARASFDSTVSHSGTTSMKLDLPFVTSNLVVSQAKSGSFPVAADVMQLLPNMQYTLTAWIRTANVPANGAYIDLREYTGGRGPITTTSTAKIGGTTEWTQVTATIMTTATTRFGQILLRNGTPGNVCTAWFDDLVLTPVTPIARITA